MTDYSKLTKQQASAKIAEILKQAKELVLEAQIVADQTGISFDINMGGYGMGGTYYPNPAEQDWSTSDDYDWYPSDTDGGWMASSQSC
jgi:hypothetical protein